MVLIQLALFSQSIIYQEKMPRKKSIKQKTKVSQKVVQNGKVIVGETKHRKSSRRPRRQPSSPEVETISSKTLAPVFIQPPVTSQFYSSPHEQFATAIRMPASIAAAQVAVQHAEEKPNVKATLSMFEDDRPVAEPLFPTKKEMLEETQFVEPVAFKSPKKLPRSHISSELPENPTTSVDSMFGIDETTGFSFDKNPTADVDFNSDFKKGMGMDVSIATENVIPNFEQTSLIPLISPSPAPQLKKIMMRIKKATIDDILSIPKNIDTTGWTRNQAEEWIRDTVQREQLTAEEFKDKYIQYSEKRKQTREIGKYKQTAFDEANLPKATSNISNISIEPSPTPMIQNVTSSATFI
jgi:hypothetical protein